MAREKRYLWKEDRWHGGESEDTRIASVKGAARYLVGFDIQQDTGLLTVAKKPVAETLSPVTIAAPIKWFETNPDTGDVYMYSGDKVIKESGGTYSAEKTIASGDAAAAQGLCHFDGKLYAFSDTKIHYTNYTAWTDNWQTGLTSSPFHPTLRFKNFMMFGHGRYIGTVDDVGTFTLARLTLPPGYVVRSMFRAGPFAVILATFGENITDSDEGMAFLWNGTTETYGDFIPLNGNPHAGIAINNKLTMIAGIEPVILESLGGIADQRFKIPDIGLGKTAEVWPGAIDQWRGMAYYGISDGTSTTVLRVVRSWGSKSSKFPAVSNPEYPISAGALTGTTLQITALKKIGTTIRYAWKNGSDYGIDEIDTTQLQASATRRSLAFDRESAYEKVGFKILVELTKPLQDDENIIVKVSPDPYGDPTFADSAEVVSQTFTNADFTERVIELPLTVSEIPIRSRDLHVEITPGGTAATKPTVKRYWLDFEEEADQL